jgi:hypothetical protein
MYELIMIIIRHLRQFRVTMVAFVIYIIFMLYPFLVILLNPAPSLSELIALSGNFSISKGESGAVDIFSGNGEKISLRFPSVNYGAFRGYGNTIVSRKDLHSVGSDCYGAAGIDRTRFFPIIPVRRIWWIKCGGVDLEYERVVAEYHKTLRFVIWVDGIGQTVALGFLFLIAYIDWRKLWRASRSMA